MNVASKSQAYVSQEFATHEVDGEFEVDEEGEGLGDAPKGRSANYTMEEDILLCRSHGARWAWIRLLARTKQAIHIGLESWFKKPFLSVHLSLH
jgi:hypothetical protein